MKVKLTAPDLPAGHKIYSILSIIRPKADVTLKPYYWNAEVFNLQNSRLYSSLSPSHKNLVLHEISQSLLREAYFIEKAGIAFAASMVEISDTTQERELYAHFAGQEACHLSLLRPYLDQANYEKSEMLEFITKIIETGDKACLTLIVQVMLEGYGLIHYHQLALNCNDITLSSALNSILKDEAQHYRAGVALFDRNKVTDSQILWIDNAVRDFKDLVSKGPIRVIEAIYDIIGYTPEELEQLHQDIDSKYQIQHTLDHLDRLIGGVY